MPDEVPFEEPSPFADVREGERASPARREGRDEGGWRRWSPYVAGVAASLVTTAVVVYFVVDWTTAKGTLTLEVDQPGALVYLDGQRWAGDVPGGMKAVRIPVREGRHEVKVVKEGFRPQTREFWFRKGAPQPIVQVRLAPPKKPARPGS
jgi:hypothetical protein